jgi:hypothetical protein
MKIDWLLMCEGISQDARGAWAAVGINQNVLASPSLPTTTKRSFLTHVTEVVGGTQVEFRMEVLNPDGRPLAVQTGHVGLSAGPIPDLPTTVDIPTEFILTFGSYGEHQIRVELSDLSNRLSTSASVSLYVVDPEALSQVP